MSDRSAKPVIVHLVHGTWPRGPFRKSSRPGKPEWFEEGSPFREEVASLAHGRFEFRFFPWSGANSYRKRLSASEEFNRYLFKSFEEETGSQHVIVAHSHGGTVVAHALAQSSRLLAGKPLRHLVCLATPFTYATHRSRNDQYIFLFVIYFIGVIFPVVPLIGLGLNESWWLLAWTAGFCLFSWFQLNRSGNTWNERDHLDGIHEPPVATTLFRGTRDEASLTIGLTQSLNWIIGWPTRRFALSPWTPFIGLLTFTLSMIFAFVYLYIRFGNAAFYLLVLVFGICPLFYFVGNVLVAVATGYFEFRDWLSTQIEVEVSPPWGVCQIRSFNLDNEFHEDDLLINRKMRHGLYTYPGVQKAIADLIDAVGLRGDNQPAF